MSEPSLEWTEQYDVVVVGSGAGALTGAYAAAHQGQQTVVLEKTALFGGTSAYSGAACWLPGNAAEVRADVTDSSELAGQYLTAVLDGSTQPRVDAFLHTAPIVLDLLEQNPDLEFAWSAFPDYFAAPGRLELGRSIMPLPLPQEQIGALVSLVRPDVGNDRAGHSHPEGPLQQGRALIGRLLLALTSTGNVTLRGNTCMDGLVVEDGRVVGVEARDAGGARVRIRARHGVLLAAGGHEGNAELRAANGTPGRSEWTMGPRGTNAGEPMEAAVAVGAATDLLGEAWWCPGAENPDGSASFLLGLRGGLFLDGEGARFGNESLPYDQMGRVLSGADSRVPCYFVFDGRSRGQLPAITVPDMDPQACLDAGVWVQSDSLEGLAEQIGVPAEALKATVETFNAYAHSGVDEEFHRGEDPYDTFFATSKEGPNPCLVPVDRAPYYAARVVLSDLGTKGGLRTDPDGRVLREDGTAIDGLYAAGNTSASMTGAVYPGPGIPIGTAMVFSYRAVQHMTTEQAA